MSRIKKYRNSVFFTWIISYLTLLLVTLSISSAVYFVSADSIEKNIRSSNNVLLKQTQQNMDAMLRDIDTLISHISLNSNLGSVIHAFSNYDKSIKYTNTKILRDFKAYKSTSQFVDSFYVYIFNTNTVYTPQSVYDAWTFFNIEGFEYYTTYESWHNFISSRHIKEYIPVTRKDVYGREHRTIAYVQSIQSLSTVVGNIVIFLDGSKISEALKNNQWMNEGAAFVIDQDDKVLLSTDPRLLSEKLRYDSLPGEQGFLTDKIAGDKSIVSYITSGMSKWKYVLAVPVNSFMKNLTAIRGLAALIVFICLLIGIGISYYFSKRNYIHISELLNVLKDNTKQNAEARENEFSLIKKAITHTLDEKKLIAEKLDQHKHVLRQDFLKSLLKDGISSSISFVDTCRTIGVNFPFTAFQVMIFIFDDSTMFFRDDSNGSYADKLLLAKFITGNVVEELVNRNCKGVIIEMDEMLVCLVNLKNENPDQLKQNNVNVAYEAKEFILENFQIGITISMSNIHNDICGIPSAYKEALEAAEYKMIYGSGEVIRFEEIKATRQIYYYPLETEYRMINYIKTGDFKAVKGILEMIYEKNFSEASLSIQTVKCLMFNLVSTIIKALDEVNNTKSGAKTGIFFDYTTDILLKCETIFDMKDRMTSLLQEVCAYIEEQKTSHNTKLRDDILEYIEANYQDMNLSVTSISDAFKMNPLYISRFFKEQSGESLVDCINRVRLEQAKKLLKQKKMNIEMIAEEVGYTNVVSFIRIFKKYEGITPGRFRESG